MSNIKYFSASEIREFLRTNDYRCDIVITPALYSWEFSSGHLSFSHCHYEFGWLSLEIFAKPMATAEDLFNEGMRMYQEIVRNPEAFFAMYEHQESLIP